MPIFWGIVASFKLSNWRSRISKGNIKIITTINLCINVKVTSVLILCSTLINGKITVTPAQTKAITYTFNPPILLKFFWESINKYLGKKGIAYKNVKTQKAAIKSNVLNCNCNAK